MGISDRDYTRADARPAWKMGLHGRTSRGGGGRWVSRLPWPAHVIVIMLCCAIFAIDSMLPAQPVQSGEWRAVAGREQAFEDLRAANAPYAIYPLLRGPKGQLVVDQSGQFLQGVWPGSVAEGIAKQYEPVAVAPFVFTTPVKKWLQFTTAQAIVHFGPSGGVAGFEVWRFVGYGFLHVSLLHLLLNMLGLWFFGPVVEERYGGARFLAIFVTSTIAGALLFLLLNAAGIAWVNSQGEAVAIPGLLFNDPWVPLIGASGGVCGIVLAAAWLRPNDEALLLYVVPMKLKWLGVGIVGMSVFTLLRQGNNSGGEAAHLGGALAGWWVAQRPHLLDDFFDVLHVSGWSARGRGATFPSREKPFGTPTGAHTGTPTGTPTRRGPDEAEIDRILDKVRESGLGSLSERERQTLRSASDERNRDGRRS
ncbi:MAG: rhomboid family intramembrane serine protease [bacterium]